MTLDKQISEELEIARKFAEMGEIKTMHTALYRIEHLYYAGHSAQELDPNFSAQIKEIEELGYKTAIKQHLANNTVSYK